VSEEFPAFDDEWVAAAQHREASVGELEAAWRAERRQQCRARRRVVYRKTIGMVVVLGCLAGFATYVVNANRQQAGVDAQFVDHVGNVKVGTVSTDRPTPTSGSHERLLPAVIADNPTASHAFVATRSDGSPVTYDPCRPVRFTVNPLNAPLDYLRIVDETLATASAASGLELELDDDTTETPSVERATFQPDRYGDQWAPVLIAWTDATTVPDLAGDVAGVGGSAWFNEGPDAGWFISGSLYIDTELGPDPESNELVMLHELGHVLGLDHVDDPRQIMNPTTGATELGDGDRAGLAAVGASDCAESL